MAVMEASVMMCWKSEKMVVGTFSIDVPDSVIAGGEMCPIFIG